MENAIEPILVFYISVGNMDAFAVESYIDRTKKMVLKDNPQKVNNWYFIPIREGHTRVECIYPKFVANQTLVDQALNQLSEINDHFNQNILMLNKPEIFKINKKNKI